MSVDHLFDHMKAVAQGAVGRMGVNRWGTVTSSRPTDSGYEVKVMFDYGADNQVHSGWLPVLAHSVGPGWGIVSPPIQGAMAFVAPDMGDGNHNVVLGMGYNVQDHPPQPANSIDGNAAPVQPGETALISQAGAVIRLCADGSIYIQGDVYLAGKLTVKNDIISTTGNIAAQKGDVSDQHGSLDRLRGHHNTHVHGGVSSGAGTTAVPTTLDPE